MLGKLVSSAADGKEAASTNTSTDNKTGSTTSAKVFKSLLQALQGDGSAKKNLLAMSSSSEDEASGDKKSGAKNILGGTFTAVSGDGNKVTAQKQLLEGEQPVIAADTLTNVTNEKIEGVPSEEKIQGQNAGNTTENDGSTPDKKPVSQVSAENTKAVEAQNAGQSAVSKETVDDTQTESASTNEQENSQKKQTNSSTNANRIQQLGGNEQSIGEKSEKTSGLTNSKATAGGAGTSGADGAKVGETKQPSGNSAVPDSEAKAKVKSPEVKPVSADSKNEATQKQGNMQAAVGEGVDAKKKSPNASARSSQSGEARNNPAAVPSAEGTATKGEAEIVSEPKNDVLQQTKTSTNSEKNAPVEAEGKIKSKTTDSTKGDKSLIAKEGVQQREAELPKKSSEVQRQRVKAAQKQSESQSQQKQAANTQSTDQKLQLTEKQKRLIDNFFQKNTSGGISEKGFELKSMQVEKQNKKGKGESKNSERARVRLPDSISGMRRMGATESAMTSTGGSSGDSPSFASTSSEFSIEEQQWMWDKQTGDSSEAQHEKETSKSSATTPTMRLGQMPITNVSLRKHILSGITKNVLKAASEAKKTPQQWQKHNFTLDDGKKIQLSVRESKGVLQVKVGSMNMDLSKLLQQNMQQIREHLKQEFGSEVDLQFEHNEQQNSSESGENQRSSDKKGSYRNGFSNSELISDGVKQAPQNTVRNFGYNKMEWTA